MGTRAGTPSTAATDGEPDEPVGNPRARRLNAAWLSAGAAAASALVAAVALVIGAFDSDHGSATAPTTATVPTTGPGAGDATPDTGARAIAISSMAFVGPGEDGPAFEFRGTAELNDPDDEEIHVIARPLSLEGALTGQSEDGETWMISTSELLYSEVVCTKLIW
jgi:hypothetical protein